MTEVDIPTVDSATVAPPDRAARVAVVIPCYNDGAFLHDAVFSVRGTRGVEVVVVDDGSTDPATQRVLDDLGAAGVTVVRQQNAGLAAARMAGVATAVAPYIYNLDADDVGIPGALKTMADCLDADSKAAVCYGDYEEFGDSQFIRLVPTTIDPFRLAYTNQYPVTAMFRRSVLQAVGGWRHLGPGYEDWRLWMTLAEKRYRGMHLGPGVITFRRRLHGERMLSAARANHPSHYKVLRRENHKLFAELATHRRASNLSPIRKLLYPIVYGGRHRFRFERRIRAWLDRVGVWTLRG